MKYVTTSYSSMIPITFRIPAELKTALEELKSEAQGRGEQLEVQEAVHDFLNGFVRDVRAYFKKQERASKHTETRADNIDGSDDVDISSSVANSGV